MKIRPQLQMRARMDLCSNARSAALRLCIRGSGVNDPPSRLLERVSALVRVQGELWGAAYPTTGGGANPFGAKGIALPRARR